MDAIGPVTTIADDRRKIECEYERTVVRLLQRRRRVDHWPAPAYPKPNPFSPAMKVRARAHSSTAATNMRKTVECWTVLPGNGEEAW